MAKLSALESERAIDALASAIAVIGSQSATGRLLGVTQGAVNKWVKRARLLPSEHVLTVETATGISRHALRPDLYPDERTAPDARLDHAAHVGDSSLAATR